MKRKKNRRIGSGQMSARHALHAHDELVRKGRLEPHQRDMLKQSERRLLKIADSVEKARAIIQGRDARSEAKRQSPLDAADVHTELGGVRPATRVRSVVLGGHPGRGKRK